MCCHYSVTAPLFAFPWPLSRRVYSATAEWSLALHTDQSCQLPAGHQLHLIINPFHSKHHIAFVHCMNIPIHPFVLKPIHIDKSPSRSPSSITPSFRSVPSFIPLTSRRQGRQAHRAHCLQHIHNCGQSTTAVALSLVSSLLIFDLSLSALGLSLSLLSVPRRPLPRLSPLLFVLSLSTPLHLFHLAPRFVTYISSSVIFLPVFSPSPTGLVDSTCR